MYITQEITDSEKLIVKGIKRKADGSFDSACLVVVFNGDNEVIQRQTTDKFGNFEFTFYFDSIDSGKYKIGYNPSSKTKEEEYDYFEIPEKPSIEYDHIPPDFTQAGKLSQII